MNGATGHRPWEGSVVEEAEVAEVGTGVVEVVAEAAKVEVGTGVEVKGPVEAAKEIRGSSKVEVEVPEVHRSLCSRRVRSGGRNSSYQSTRRGTGTPTSHR